MKESEYKLKKRLINCYKKNAQAWKDEHDDRRIYSNTYYTLIEALEEMKETENLYIICAFNAQYRKDIEMLNDIEQRFQGR